MLTMTIVLAAAALTAPAAIKVLPGLAAAPSTATETAKPAKRIIYCLEGTLTGTRIKDRQCHSRKEWLDRGVDPTNPDK